MTIALFTQVSRGVNAVKGLSPFYRGASRLSGYAHERFPILLPNSPKHTVFLGRFGQEGRRKSPGRGSPESSRDAPSIRESHRYWHRHENDETALSRTIDYRGPPFSRMSVFPTVYIRFVCAFIKFVSQPCDQGAIRVCTWKLQQARCKDPRNPVGF
jgi:hypothetical protein